MLCACDYDVMFVGSQGDQRVAPVWDIETFSVVSMASPADSAECQDSGVCVCVCVCVSVCVCAYSRIIQHSSFTHTHSHTFTHMTDNHSTWSR